MLLQTEKSVFSPKHASTLLAAFLVLFSFFLSPLVSPAAEEGPKIDPAKAVESLFEPIPELNGEIRAASEIGRLELLFEFAFNLLFIFIYAYFIYYRRHHDHKMLFLLLGFNLFLFPIFLLNTVLSTGFGFTIFALLALVRLRSENFDKAEVAYLLGAVSLTFTNSVLPAKVEYIASVLVLATAYFGDHPRLWRDAYQNVQIRLPLDEMDRMLDIEWLRRRVEREFGVEVNDLEIERVEKNRVRLQVMYREEPAKRTQLANRRRGRRKLRSQERLEQKTEETEKKPETSA